MNSFCSNYSILEVPEMVQSLTGKKLNRIRNLGAGWHFGEGVSFTEQIIQDAENLLLECGKMGLSDTDVFPGLNGEIVFSVYSGEFYLEFTIYPEGMIDFIKEKNDSETETEEDVRLVDAIKKLKVLQEELWKSSGYLMYGITTTGEKSGLTVSPSAQQANRLEYRSLMQNAFGNINDLSAAI